MPPSDPPPGRQRPTTRRRWRDPLGLFGLVVCALIALVALTADIISPQDPARIAVAHRLEGPSAQHWLGTDHLGRDTASRIITGTRTAMGVALLSIGIAVVIGTVLGLLAGYGPRWLGTLLLLVLDTISSLPMIMFALAILTLLGPGLWTLVGTIAFFTIPSYARLVRAQTMALSDSPFIQAERSMGASFPRILFIHLLPNVIGPLLVVMTMDIPVVIGLEAGLSFLGIGIQPPTPSWGSMLNDGFVFIRNTPLLVIFAGLPIVIATLSFTFLGEALRERLDPAARRA
ncbi:ABC transporter permease [Niveispirillum sp. KHB5.9]|uniref:ABC transporter permease n=1 Tax=Niveispirillum sp. KHB5.9 TaxID=3400269 RepID=UPI003A88BB40